MKNKKINLYILGLIIINLVQSFLTPIIKDEAYYRVFSKNLNFGYFDHPPMVAFIIKLSSYFFHDELGIRFITVLLMALTTKVIWELIPDKNKEHKYSELIFFIIMFSIPIFNIYGFITTSDSPLICFSVLFVWSLKKIEKKDSFLNILMFAVSAALLIYSKYHGAIVILLSVLFKLNILKKTTTYIAVIIGLVLIFPHLYWQYQNDFITFDYHLLQRRSVGFNIKNVYHYILSFVGILNPAFIILLFVHLAKNRKSFKKEDIFLIRLFIGFLIFFLFYSFRARIEAHWVAFAMIPMSILLYNLSVSNHILRRQIKYIGIASIFLIFSARVLITLNIPIKTEFHEKKKDYYQAISALANGKKVVFVNSYQEASKYSFYTGEKSFSDNSLFSRKNQYDLLNYEEFFHNKQVLLIGNSPSSSFYKLKTGDSILYKEINNYPMFNKLKATIDEDNFYVLHKNEIGKGVLTVNNPYTYAIDLQQENLPYQIILYLQKDGKRHFVPLKIEGIRNLNPNTNNIVNVSWNLGDMLTGEYKLQIVMKAGYLYPKAISKKYDVQIGIK